MKSNVEAVEPRDLMDFIDGLHAKGNAKLRVVLHSISSFHGVWFLLTPCYGGRPVASPALTQAINRLGLGEGDHVLAIKHSSIVNTSAILGLTRLDESTQAYVGGYFTAPVVYAMPQFALGRIHQSGGTALP